MWLNPKSFQPAMVQVLDEEGRLVGELPELPNEQLYEMYRWMVLARVFDERVIRMQRQGRLGTYAPYSGQEAAILGSAFALEKKDWLFPSYREMPALWVHGVPMKQGLLYFMGHLQGGHVPEDVHAFPMQIIIGAQTLHAMGSAWASKYLKDDSVSLCYLGDGATSQGDFHEALNFASVMQLPAVYFVQNNQWAISLPRSRQSASETLAQKGLAYNIPGIQVDGNDLLAVYQVTKEAIQRARTGGGPSLIEAVTFRQGPHTTSDDPTRYRNPDDVDAWLRKDPLRRLQTYLTAQGVLVEGAHEALTKAVNEQVTQVIAEAESTPKSTLADLFGTVYADAPQNVVEQKQSAEATAKGESPWR